MKKFLTTLLIAAASASSAGVVEDSKATIKALGQLKDYTDALAVEAKGQKEDYDNLRQDLIDTFGVNGNQSDTSLVDSVASASDGTAAAYIANQFWPDIRQIMVNGGNPNTLDNDWRTVEIANFQPEHIELYFDTRLAELRAALTAEPEDPSWYATETSEFNSRIGYSTTNITDAINQTQFVLDGVNGHLTALNIDGTRPHWRVGELRGMYEQSQTDLANAQSNLTTAQNQLSTANTNLQSACDILTIAQLATAPQALQDACN